MKPIILHNSGLKTIPKSKLAVVADWLSGMKTNVHIYVYEQFVLCGSGVNYGMGMKNIGNDFFNRRLSISSY